ncbi:MAG: 23S rRNA (guanosine(2251)-2'-O)-methyltransferase RlmB [Erysipelotrichaceae bacterium]|nr:23S rRNA (guanosine(2251)-2'-O)-methyltransferase RlmB [Erysipelotrichaceae bacterium]MBR6233235.1 23S rRNA (guanosine(2251)-2'-O)-methyltransferase RlmB [Erysipelotrichaceae bacterium]
MSDYVYGKNSFFEALNAGRIVKAYVLNDQEIRNRKIPYKIVDRKKLDSMVKGNHQGYVAEVKPYELADVNDMIKEKNGLIVMLDGLEDVHNLGAIIRTAECAGADGVIYKSHNAVKVNETVAKVACGALEYMKVAEVTNLVNTIKQLKKAGYWIVGSAGEAEQMYNQIDYDMNVVLVIGSEGKGMSRLVREECDFMVKLPMYGKVTSLNASVAAGILIYNVLDKRKK